MRMLAASLIVAGSALVGCAETGPSFRGTEYEAPAAVEDFTLTDHHGLPFKLSDHEGAIVLLFFGYTHCPDVCPVTLSTWTKVEKLLGDDAERVRFAFVTVDPERDSLERLREHMAVFSPKFIGLGGETEDLEPVYDLFGVSHEKIKVSTSAVGYLVDHSATAFLIDPRGRLRLKYEFDAPSEDIVHDIRSLLKSAPRIHVEDAWSRPTAGEDGVGVVYLSLINDGDVPDRLIGVRSAVCESAEIHRTFRDGDSMRMAPVEGGVEIPARGRFAFEPGGYHVMLVGLQEGLQVGDRFELVLDFEESSRLTLTSHVRRP